MPCPRSSPETVGPLVDASRVVVAGHSAGGHLALWSAGRVRLPAGSPWHAERPPAAGVVSLAGVCDLAACYRLGLDGDAAGDLMGGGPDSYPERYAAADPMGLVPTGTVLRLVHGTEDERVPVEQSPAYTARAVAAGDDARCDVLDGLWPLRGHRPAHVRVAAGFGRVSGGGRALMARRLSLILGGAWGAGARRA